MSSYIKNSHCSYCGTAFEQHSEWPRTCANCGRTTYLNPLPVAVVLLPVDEGLLVVRRAVAPHIGELALPGGFIGLGESWQEAAARELREETDIVIDPAEIQDFRVMSAPDGTVLIFGVAEHRASADLPPFTPTNESSERLVILEPQPLAFSLHTHAVEDWWERRIKRTVL